MSQKTEGNANRSKANPKQEAAREELFFALEAEAENMLKANSIREGLEKYEEAINVLQETDNQTLIKTNIERIVKLLNDQSMRVLNKASSLEDSLAILQKCESLTYPGKFGVFPEMRTHVFNYLGCLYRRKEHFQIAINYFVKALRIIETSKLLNCRAMTHMNLSAVLSQMGNHEKAMEHAKYAVTFSGEDLESLIRQPDGEDKRGSKEFYEKSTTCAICYHDLGAEEEHNKNYKEALRCYKMSLTILEENCGKSHRLYRKFGEHMENFIKFLKAEDEKQQDNTNQKSRVIKFNLARTLNNPYLKRTTSSSGVRPKEGKNLQAAQTTMQGYNTMASIPNLKQTQAAKPYLAPLGSTTGNFFFRGKEVVSNQATTPQSETKRSLPKKKRIGSGGTISFRPATSSSSHFRKGEESLSGAKRGEIKINNFNNTSEKSKKRTELERLMNLSRQTENEEIKNALLSWSEEDDEGKKGNKGEEDFARQRNDLLQNLERYQRNEPKPSEAGEGNMDSSQQRKKLIEIERASDIEALKRKVIKEHNEALSQRMKELQKMEKNLATSKRNAFPGTVGATSETKSPELRKAITNNFMGEPENQKALPDDPLANRINSLKYQIGTRRIALGPLLSKYDVGGVSKKDLAGVLRSIDTSLTVAETSGIVQRINSKGLDRVPVKEVSRFFKKLPESYAAEIESIIQEISQDIKDRKLSLLEVFQAIDTDHSGELSLEEFERIVKKISPRMNRERIWWLFRRFDKNGNGTVSFEEFNSYFKQLERTEQMLLKLESSMREKALSLESLFGKFDEDNSSFIDYREFEKMISHVDKDIERKDILGLFQRFDHDGDDHISIAEFKKTFKDIIANSISPEQVDTTIDHLRFIVGVNKIPLSDVLSKSHPNGTMNEDEIAALIRTFEGSLSTGVTQGIVRRLNSLGVDSMSNAEVVKFFKELPRGFYEEIEDTLQMVVRTVTQRSLSLAKLYQNIDTDKSGELSLEEFSKLMRAINSGIADEKIYWFFRRFDIDNDGKLSFREFQEFFRELDLVNELLQKIDLGMRVKEVTIEKLTQRYMDREGLIGAEELKALVNAVASNVEKKQLNTLLKRLDHEGRGRIPAVRLKRLMEDAVASGKIERTQLPVEEQLKANKLSRKNSGGRALSEDEIDKIHEGFRISMVSKIRHEIETIVKNFESNGVRAADIAQILSRLAPGLKPNQVVALSKRANPRSQDKIRKEEMIGFLQALPHGFSIEIEETIAELRELMKIRNITPAALFRKADSDGSGEITPQEFEKMMNQFSRRLDKPRIRVLFRRFDKDNDGLVTTTEFKRFFGQLEAVEMIMKRMQEKMKEKKITLDQLFKEVDADNSGDVVLEEFERLVLRLEPTIEKKLVDLIFSRFDHDGDGRVSSKEFKKTFEEVNAGAVRKSPKDQMIERTLSALKVEMRFKNITAQQLLSRFDRDRSGEIDFDEFEVLVHAIDKKLHKIDIRAIFERLDADNSSTISVEELIHELSIIPEPSYREIEEMMQRLLRNVRAKGVSLQRLFATLDKDSSGGLSLQEFEKMIKYIVE